MGYVEQEVSVSLKLDIGQYYIGAAHIEQLYFIEDILSYSIVGKIMFDDRKGILEFGPLTGNEQIVIDYGREDELEKTFDIYKISRIIPSESNSAGKWNFIEILFVDTMFYNLTNRQYSISWKDTKHSTIVEDLSNNMIEIENKGKWETTNETASYFYMPYWTVKQGIDWLIKRSTGSKSGQGSYVYYNALCNDYNFKTYTNFITIEKLLQQSSTEKFNITGNILEYSISGIDNHSRLLLKGGTRRGYDTNRKKFLQSTYKYKDDQVSKFTMLGKYTLFEDISDPETRHDISGDDLISTIDTVYDNDWLKRYCMQQTLNIIVEGDEKRHAGSMIKIEWPSTHEDQIINKNFDNGNYLVKSITHQIIGGGKPYQQKLILIKNAYEDSDKTDLVKSKKKNLG